MYQRRPRRFRRNQSGRNHQSGGDMQRMRFNSFSNGHVKSRFNSSQSAEKLLEKYNTLAQEALSSGDKTLSENYFQHADHFMRIIEDKNRNQNQLNNKPSIEDKNKNRDQSKASIIDKSSWDDKSISKNSDIKQKDVPIKKE